MLYVAGKHILFLPFEFVILKTGNTSHTQKCMNKEVFLVPKELEGTSAQLIFSLTMKSWKLIIGWGRGLQQDTQSGKK